MALSVGQIMEYGEKQALNQIFLKTQGPAAASTYLALLTAAPAAGTDLTMAAETEFSTSDGYARQSFAPGAASSASPSVISNGSTITFGPITTGAPGTCSWGMVVDASTGTSANNIASYLLANARTPLVGDSLTAAGGAFTCQVQSVAVHLLEPRAPSVDVPRSWPCQVLLDATKAECGATPGALFRRVCGHGHGRNVWLCRTHERMLSLIARCHECANLSLGAHACGVALVKLPEAVELIRAGRA